MAFARIYSFKELEEIEEKWKQETMKLIGMVNKLKDDNKRLNESLAQTSSTIKQNDQLSKRLYLSLWFERPVK